MASTNLCFHARIILLLSVLCVTAAPHANYTRPLVVGGHEPAELAVSAGRGICVRTRATASFVSCSVFAAAECSHFRRQPPHAPGVAPSATAHHLELEAACALDQEDEEGKMLLLLGPSPPRPRPRQRVVYPARQLPMDRGSLLLPAIPNGHRGANYTVLLFAERPSLAVNFVVDPARILLLSSNSLSSVYKNNPSLSHGNISLSVGHLMVLIIPVNSSSERYAFAACRLEEQLPANCSMAYLLTVLREQEQIREEYCYVSARMGRLCEDLDPLEELEPIELCRKETRFRESSKIRKLLPDSVDSHGRIASTRKRHVAIRRQIRWTRRLRASVAAGGLSLLGLICAVATGLLLCCTRRKRLRRQSAAVAMAVELEEFENSKPILNEQFRGLTWPRRFLYSEMAAATHNFAEETKIGRGGFGPVYRGYLNDDDRHVAIKVLRAGEQSRQGMREFQAEVTVMSQLRHRNIVQLLGWCDCLRGLLLAYEFMPEGSLDKHLYDTDRLLSWPDRYKIALGLGSALQYLHQDCDRCVVHGDIKPANVMLDASRNAKLGDFGLARLVDHGAEPQTTQVVAGTVGYIDPEFVDSHRPSTESDVYSFGVVLLEIACGRRPTSSSRRPDGAPALLSFVRGMYDRGTVLDAADERLNGEFDERQMERVLVTGLWCACHDVSRRPSVAQAVEALRAVGAELPVLAPARIGADRSLVELRAYGDLSVEFSTAHATAYLTSSDSTYLLAAEE